MRFSRNFFLWLLLNLFLALLVGGALPMLAQQPPTEKKAPALTAEQALRRDAQRLAELSLELSKEIEKSNENVLPLKLLQRAEELERLARELRERARP